MDEESNNTVRFEEFKEKETVEEESIKVALYNPEENQIVSEPVEQESTLNEEKKPEVFAGLKVYLKMIAPSEQTCF